MNEKSINLSEIFFLESLNENLNTAANDFRSDWIEGFPSSPANIAVPFELLPSYSLKSFREGKKVEIEIP